MNNIWSQARDLIAGGQLAKSLALLRQQTGLSPESDAELVIYQARLSQLEREERLLGNQETIERNRITKGVLDFIQNADQGNLAASTAANPINLVRKIRLDNLQQKIKDVYDLIAQWEQKQTLSDNPTEIKRCEMEILRLQTILNGHLKEWGELE